MGTAGWVICALIVGLAIGVFIGGSLCEDGQYRNDRIGK